jgi:hypothetical protein
MTRPGPMAKDRMLTSVCRAASTTSGVILNWSGDVKPSISVERLIAQQNILRFERLLETEFDPATRANLLRLLLQEEDKLG